MIVKVMFALAVASSLFHSVLAQPANPSSVAFANITVPSGFQMIANPLNATDNSIGELIKDAPEGTILFRLSDTSLSTTLTEQELARLQPLITKLPPNVAAPVNLRWTDSSLTLAWTGTLETAEEAVGPFRVLVDAVSPTRLVPDEPRRFWRARKPILDLARFKANHFENGEWSHPAETLRPGEGAIILNPSSDPFTITFAGEVLQGNLTNTIPAGLSIRSSMVLQAGEVTSKLGLKLSPGDHVFVWNEQQFVQATVSWDNAWAPAEPQIRVGESFFIYAHSATNWQRSFSSNP